MNESLTVPDAAIEAAAEALRNGPVMQGFNDIARAAIEAAMPAIREAIAQEVLAMGSENHSHHGLAYGVAKKVAARIVRGTP